ncbi:hypothetical protein AALH12_06915 [Streptococcus ferus]|uniref:hypothetical protein n=1 Tax=Streptococcus ferus TaxID=1345 RepID=UPI0035156E15
MPMIEMSMKEYMVMMLYLHLTIRTDDLSRWELQSFLPEQVSSEREVDLLYDSVFDFNDVYLHVINPNQKVILLKFVGILLEEYEEDSLFFESL